MKSIYKWLLPATDVKCIRFYMEWTETIIFITVNVSPWFFFPIIIGYFKGYAMNDISTFNGRMINACNTRFLKVYNIAS